MRQAVEAQVLTSHCALGEHDLRQILSDVIEEVRRSINKDIDGAEVLNSLLNAPWLHALLKVYECLQRFNQEQPASYLNYASGLSLQLVLDIASLPGSSEEAQELCRLLRQPHFQALLSAHDTVAQKDYDPVLPPMPEELPDHEEATRVVCLVKNKQPLQCENQGTGLALPDSSLPHAPTRSSLGGIRSQWATLKRRLSRGGGTGQDVKEQSKETVRRGSLLSGERVRRPPPVPPYPPPSSRYKPMGNCRVCFRNPVSPCRSCYANSLWEKSHSSPSGSSSLLMDDVDSLDLDSPSGSARAYCTPAYCHQQPRWSLSPPQPRRSTAGYYSNLDTDRRLRIDSVPCCGFRTRSHSLCVRTAPPSPMTPRHHPGGPRGLGVIVDFPRGGGLGGGHGPPVELAKQESLDELRSAVQLAAGSMASGTEDVRRLGEKMAAATERVSESARDNTRALALLAQVVERLQGIVEVAAASRTEEAESRVPASTTPRANRKARDGEQRDPQQQALMGATIKRNDATGEIFIARVIYGGLADRSGLLHAGDRVIEVNGFPVDGLEPEQVIQVVARSQGTIVFKVVPISERPVHYQTMLYMRAMADYSPLQDPTIPCADAGMSFRRGDVLEIVDQTDALWWQAKKMPSTTDCAGLIPSSNLLKRKQREFWWSQPYQPQTCIHTLSTVDEEEDSIGIDEKCVEADEEAFESEELRDEGGEFSNNVDGVYIAGFRRSMRLCRRRAHSTAQPSCHVRCPTSCFSSLASPYEEVVRYQRSPHDPYRLVVLLGPSSVGVNELRRRLLEIDPRVFQGAVPHTTRPPRSYEESGREYHFTTREVFENLVYNNRFLEYGEYKGHFYGTSTEAVKDVLNSGKMCIIDIEPNAIQAVRTHELKAFIIYVKPPPAECLRETRKNAQITTNYYVNRPFKDEDFQETEEAARKMESHYSQFFDQVIVNEELGVACGELLGAVTRAQDGPQWVPASWIRPTDES